MPILSDDKIAGIALNAGFTGTNLTIAVAVALAESSGKTDNYNGNAATGDSSYGLWQINMIGDMGPERREKYNLRNNEELFDPSTNARVAYALWNERGWGQWGAYNKGAYLRYMPRAGAAVKLNGGKSVVTGSIDPNAPGKVNLNRPDTAVPDVIENTIYDIRDSLSGVKNVIDFFTNSDNWIRVGMFIGGGVLVSVGMFMLIGQSKAAQTVAKAIPVGRAVKAAKGVK